MSSERDYFLPPYYVRPGKYALASHVPGEDDYLDDALGYNLDQWHQQFVSNIVMGMSGAEAAKEADAFIGRSRSYTRQKQYAYETLNCKNEIGPRVVEAIATRKIRAAIRTGFNEEEFYLSVRRLEDISLGKEKLRKTQVTYSEDGRCILKDIEVAEPSVQGLARAAEFKGRNLRLLTDRVEHGATPELLAGLYSKIRPSRAFPAEEEDVDLDDGK